MSLCSGTGVALQFLLPRGSICPQMQSYTMLQIVRIRLQSQSLFSQGKLGKPFMAFVQLLSTGELYVEGVLQKVHVTGALQGMSDHVKATFKLTESQKSGSFRVTAVPFQELQT